MALQPMLMTSGRPCSNGIHPSLAGHRHQASACHHWEVMAHSGGQSMPGPRCRPLLSLSLSPRPHLHGGMLPFPTHQSKGRRHQCPCTKVARTQLAFQTLRTLQMLLPLLMSLTS